MTIRYLEIFIAVCEHRSTVKAASRLHISQPAVSLAVKELESYYKIRLFDRIGRTLVLTENGKTFLERAKTIVSMFNTLSSIDEQKVSVGASITIGTYMMPQLVKELQESNPEVVVSTIVSDSISVVKAIREGRVDLGLIETPLAETDDIYAKPLMNDSLVAACSHSHPLCTSERISIEELSGYRLCVREKGCASRNIIDALFERNGADMKVSYESISNQGIVEAARNRIGVAILPTLWVTNNDLHPVWIDEKEVQRRYSLICLKRKKMTKAMKAVEEKLFSPLLSQ